MIAISSRLDEERLFHYARMLLLSMAAAWILMLGVTFLFFSKTDGNQGVVVKEQGAVKPKKGVWNHDQIGLGPLCLNPHSYSPFVAKLSEAFVLMGKNSRPDVSEKQATLTIGVRGEKGTKTFQMGEPFFIASGKEGVGFSSEPTACLVKPRFNANREVVFDMVRHVEGKEEQATFVVDEMDPAESEALYFKSILGAKLWTGDVLLRLYGGEEEKALSAKQKIEFSADGNSSVCLVSQGDYLSWDGRGWRTTPLAQADPKSPIALVRSASAKEVELSVWDETGFICREVKLGKQADSRMDRKTDGLLQAPRLRSANQVSCVMGKRRIVIKVGDWVLKTPSGWHNLRTAEEIEDCIHYRTRGQLFVFDSLDKEGGAVMLRGHLFDEMRSSSQEIALPVSQEKKQTPANRKRKPKDLP
jgi:hypothetical protein